MRLVGKVYGKVLIKRARECTRGRWEGGVIYDDQGGFRGGRGCLDHLIAMRCMCGKYFAKIKDAFWCSWV